MINTENNIPPVEKGVITSQSHVDQQPLPMRGLAVALIMGLLGGFAGAFLAVRTPGYQQFAARQSLGQNNSQTLSFKEDSFIIDVVKKDSPAVVSIVISKDLNKIPGYGTSPFGDSDPFFNFFQSPPKSSGPNVQQIGAGSGFLVSADGVILTNKHVVEDSQASYTVITTDGKKYDATVLSRDPVNDLAIVKINIQNAPKLDLADSGEIQIGQHVVAIGNSLGQYQNTVTSGIVSGIGRSITAGGEQGSENLEGVIQTDAAINPGNSGGPLLNAAGQVIGINTAIDQQGQLVGFAIPSNDANKALLSFQKNGRIVRPYLGIRYVNINETIAQQENLPKNYGALVVRGNQPTDFAVIPGSPAEKAGIMENDLILQINGSNIDQSHTLTSLLKKTNVGDIITLHIYRKGQELDVKVTLGEAK